MDDKWLEVSVDTTDAGIEDLSAYLTAFDTGGLVIEDEAEFHAFLEQNRQYWDYVDDELLARMKGVARVKFYVTDNGHGQAKLDAVRQGLPALRQRCGADLGTLEVRTAQVREADWAYGWQKYYQPMAVGDRLYIVPEWERGKAVPDGRVPVYLNPGLAFGTGSHASTQLCLGLLEQCLQPGDAVLDLGCGSGILAIAALALGAGRVDGVDIDPKAVDVARENAGLNGFTLPKATFLAGDVLSDQRQVEKLEKYGPYRVVLANIVADVIIPLSAFAGRFMAPGGVFLCSGIIDTRAEEVRAALEKNGLCLFSRLEKDGWCAFAARKKA